MSRHKNRMWYILPLFAILWTISSCDKGTDTDPDPNPPGPGPGPNPNPPTVTGCKSCEYYPACPGSRLVYLDSVYPAAPVTYTDSIVAYIDSTIGGLVYRGVKVISSRYPQTEFINCKDGIYRFAGHYGFSSGPFTFLKSNAPVGTSWVEYPSTGVMVTLSIEGKGLTINVNNQDYSDVIKVKMIINGSGSLYTGIYYFAKGVGIVKFEFGNWNFDANWYHRNNLQSYYIP